MPSLKALLLTLSLCSVLAVTSAHAAPASPINLRTLITDILRTGITLEGAGHGAHFNGSDTPQLTALEALTQDIGLQLSSFPLSSSAGGFTYDFDPELSIFTRTSESFGPVYGQRHNSIGKGRFNVGVNFSQYTFDEVDGLSLRDGDMRLVFGHEDEEGDGTLLAPFEGDLVTAKLFLELKTSITAFVATFGATEKLDIGLAIPMVEVEVNAAYEATVRRLATGDDSTVHQFENGTDTTTFGQRGSASGLGDVVLRGHYQVSESSTQGIALAADVRMPTGEERDLLGSGEWQLTGKFIAAKARDNFSGHVSLGYSLASGETPAEIPHGIGFDWAAHERLTLSADFVGRRVLDTQKVEIGEETYQFNVGTETVPVIEEADFPVIGVEEDESRLLSALSVGAKINVASSLLLTFNAIVSVSEDGLTDRVTPLIGVDYSF